MRLRPSPAGAGAVLSSNRCSGATNCREGPIAARFGPQVPERRVLKDGAGRWLHTPSLLLRQPVSTTMFNATANATATGPAGPPPWYQFPACAAAPWAFVFYFGVKVFNLAVGAPGNALVLWRIGRGRGDAATSDVFVLNLAALDGFFCLMTPVDMGNRLLLDDPRVWYLQRFSYGLKDLAPLFLVSPLLVPDLLVPDLLVLDLLVPDLLVLDLLVLDLLVPDLLVLDLLVPDLLVPDLLVPDLLVLDLLVLDLLVLDLYI
ncbi:hypothetical protein EYF80_055987 [Liparis tanakae]|uniref:G-protein coupled receptors family 1 profile domain-containing protein n=1 Tax=Liparis tanakae TaxID=230148 RepID=A0A4Z2F032_9TELE|nr:hypothetical protein EYF80_055987 [Liparis tanakae]